MIVEEEVWDGVSPIEENRLYRFNNFDDVRRALVDKPIILEQLEEEYADIISSNKDGERQKIVPLQTINRSDLLEKTRRLLPNRPDLLKQLGKLLDETDLSHNPGQKPEPRLPHKLKIEYRITNSELGNEGESSKKKKLSSTAVSLASTDAYSEAICELDPGYGTNGYTTYSSPVRQIVATGGYNSFYSTEYGGKNASYWEWYNSALIYYDSSPTYYDPGGVITFGAWINYDQENNVERRVSTVVRIYNIWEQLIDSDSNTKTYTWSFIEKGDCELDGDIDIFDLLKILKFINPDYPPPSPGNEQHAGDLDDDGDCDIFDLSALLNLL